MPGPEKNVVMSSTRENTQVPTSPVKHRQLGQVTRSNQYSVVSGRRKRRCR
jgi:hypothetical protein